jgi:hypothetical protein
MSMVLTFAALASFFVGLIGLVRPTWVGLPSRWAAAALLGFSIIPSVADGEFYPKPEVSQASGSTLVVGLLWMCCVVLIAVIRIARRAQKLSNGKPVRPLGGVVGGLALKWANRSATKRCELADRETAFYASLPPFKIPLNNPSEPNTPPQKSPNRLEKIVAARVAVEHKRVIPSVPKARKPRTAAGPETSIEPPVRDHTSGWAGFLMYKDSKGEISERRIVIKRVEGYGRIETIHAWCCEREAYRRFRVDRIVELVDAETGEFLEAQAHLDLLSREGAVGITDKSLADLVVILVFLARCDDDFHPLEVAAIDDAILQHMMVFGGEPKAARKASASARKLAPDAEDFISALERISKHPRCRELAEIILVATEDVMAADGSVKAIELEWYLPISDALEDMAEAA